MRIAPLLLFLVLFASCGGEQGPTVLRLVGTSPGLSEVSSWTMVGKRDGARTRATANLVLASGQEIRVDLLLAYDPQPVLAGGSWSSGSESGTVTAESVRFVGGQGEGPSVGGNYVLADDRNLPRYRIQLPLTPIATPNPSP